MIQEYSDWIKKRVPNFEAAYGQCKTVCKEMMKEFPGLSLVKGFYEDPIVGDRQHWWLKTKDNEIIDPTAIQFPSVGMFGGYREIADDDALPKGKCMNCGKISYFNSMACSEKCEKELDAYYG
jgi:hypothetical protein